jgi:ketosteroid isomerase-like protein
MYLLPLIFSLLSMLSVATFWTPRAAASGSQEKQNDTSIVERADAYRKAVVAADLPALASMFDDDAILMPPNQPFLRGRLSIRHFYEDWCHSQMRPTAFVFDHLDATVSGDSAYDVGTYKMSIPAGPGRSIDDTGKYTVLLKRSAGECKIAYLIFNSDLPPHPPVVAPPK